MDFELDSVSPAGARLIELAEKHAEEFAGTADQYDRDGRFPFDNWARMRESGFLAGPVPDPLGGLGVTAVRDLAAAVGRLARGDPATAIGVAMHASAFWTFARLYATAGNTDPALATRLRLLLRRCARGHAVACVAVSEPGTSPGWPDTTAVPVTGGYEINGRKTFCTNSPAATLFLSTVRVRVGGGDRLGFGLLPRETAGLTVRDNWDALGMRASGSGEVRYAGARVPAELVMDAGPLGALSGVMLPLVCAGVLALCGAFLGVAERAQQELVGGRPGTAARAGAGNGSGSGGDPSAGGRADRQGTVAVLVGENEIDLAAGRGVLDRTAAAFDDRLAGGVPPTDAEWGALMAQVQCANMAVKRAAIAVVDRALTATGGRGYLAVSPLSRLYRDVRAGPFMQPFSALEAAGFIGGIRLGSSAAPGEPIRPAEEIRSSEEIRPAQES